MTRMHWLGLVACAWAIGCEPVYPNVEDTGVADATVDDSSALADASTDATAQSDVGAPDAATDSVAQDTGPAIDVQGDATAVADTADAVGDTVDTLADTAPDAIADAADSLDAQDAIATADSSDGFAELPISPTNIDVIGVDWGCSAFNWQPGACVAGVETSPPLLPGIHVDLPNPITYADSPPSSGTHRPVWGKWGSYIFLPQQRWLHNIEHGAIAFLYNPCVPETTIAALKAIIKAQPADDTGPFRWVLTPYPGLKSTLALVSWGHLYEAECVQTDEIKAFISAHYRKAPEDEPYPGQYEELWLGDWP